MKIILAIVLVFCFFFSYSQNGIRCIKSASYQVISNNGQLVKKKGKAIACYNKDWFSFSTDESGPVTFKIEKPAEGAPHTPQIVESYDSEASDTKQKGYYSVFISHDPAIKITINYPFVKGGYTIILSNKSWCAAKDTDGLIQKRIMAIKKSASDTLSRPGLSEKTSGTEATASDKEIYVMVEEAAQFPGGATAMMDFIQTNLHYPPQAMEAGITGRCYLKFTVSSMGDLRDIEILKGVPGCQECNEEAVRMVKTMPNWKPGKLNGKNVASWFNLPITFRKD